MERKLKGGWISNYITLMEKHESPERFHLWTGLFAIASAMGRKTYLDRVYYKLYPNLYMCILAGSGSCRKTVAADMAINIMSAAGIHDIGQKMTPVALIQSIISAGEGKDNSEIIIYNDELATLFSKNDAMDLIDILTALYTCKSKWAYVTVARKEETLINMCANMLICGTPSSAQKCFTQREMEEGFLSRLILVYEPEGRKFPLFRVIPDEEKQLREDIIHDLAIISTISGEFHLTNDALEWVENWYANLKISDDDIAQNIDGYLARKHDLLFKLGMSLSTGLDDSLIINKGMLQAAEIILAQNESFMGNALGKVQENDIGMLQGKVLDIIKKQGFITHTNLMRKMVHLMNKQALDLVIETLCSAGLTEIVLNDTKGRTYIYKGYQ